MQEVIDPGQVNWKSNYLDGSNHIDLTDSITLEIYAEIVESEVTYDANLGPFDSKKTAHTIKLDAKNIKPKNGTF
jgi:hypothetical protein